jgi:uncharacterized Zn-binding protein involved in type VI secretion
MQGEAPAMSMNAAARVGDPIGHSFSQGLFGEALDGLFFARRSEVDMRAGNLGRLIARGLSGGRWVPADGQLTLGSRDVFINGRPATMAIRSTGQCRQHSGLRTVVSGSRTVSINQREAARVSDTLDCGALILEGSPDVRIGQGPPPSTCDLLRADATKIAQFLVEAQAAQAVYDPPGERTPPPGYRNATPEDLRRLNLTEAMLEHPIDPSSGEPSEFRAGVFVNNATGAPLVAFKGTTMTSASDWGQNFAQGLGMDAFYYNHSQRIGRKVINAAGGAGTKTRFVGHSLGGGMASAAARSSGLPATTFNAAGLRSNTVSNALPSEIDGVYLDGEILRASQEIPGMPRTAETRAWRLPPDEPEMSEGIRQAYERDGILAAGKYAAMRSVNLHLMDEVIPAIHLKQRSIALDLITNGCG